MTQLRRLSISPFCQRDRAGRHSRCSVIKLFDPLGRCVVFQLQKWHFSNSNRNRCHFVNVNPTCRPPRWISHFYRSEASAHHIRCMQPNKFECMRIYFVDWAREKLYMVCNCCAENAWKRAAMYHMRYIKYSWRCGI